MKNNQQYTILLSLLILVFFSACKDDELETNTGTIYENGIFITNEGPFQNGTGTLSFYDKDSKESTSKIYQKANDGEELGNIVQSIAFTEDQAILVVNNANKVVFTDAKTFEKQHELRDFNQPRYALPLANKCYVTEWGTGENAGKVQVIDRASHPPSIIKIIDVGNQPEQLLMHENHLYVANSGGFDKDSTLSVIQTITDEVVETIHLGAYTPTHLVQSNNKIWVICRGFSDYVNPNNSTNGALIEINATTWNVLSHTELANGADNLVINNAGNTLYYTAEGKVYQFDIATRTIADNPLINKDLYSLAIDPETGNLLGADAKDYTSNGEVFIYDTNGNILDSFPVGIIPGEFGF